MGYYTYYSMRVEGENLQSFMSDFEAGAVEAEYGTLDDMFDPSGYAHDSMKWYDRREDMTRISIRYPNTLFIIAGAGEDSDDKWKEYYRNGQMEHVYAEITYPGPTSALMNNEPMPGTEGNEDIADEDF